MSLIAIIDDRISNRNIFAQLARSIEQGVKVETFGDPLEALDWLTTHTPDLIITDYKMPQMDASGFIRRFREFPGSADIPVIVITIFEERSFRLQALEAGATDFLNSPVDHHEFRTRARNLLNLRKHQLLLANRAHLLERELEHSERSRELVLRDSRERLAQVIDTVPVMISATGYDGQILFVNANQMRFFGVDAAAVVGAKSEVLVGGETAERAFALDRMVFETGKGLPPYEETMVGGDGDERVFLTSKAPLRDHANSVIGVLTTSLDITERKQTEAHLRHLAHHDTLTNLPNRTALGDKIRALVARARRESSNFAVHLLDLDRFKSINDLLGHSGGNRFLVVLAEHLREALADAEMIARLSADQFVIVQGNASGVEAANTFAQRILDTIHAHVAAEDQRLTTTASIGIAVYPSDGSDPEDLLKNADLAMYKAKEKGGNIACFYAADLQMRAQQSAILDKELRHAIAEDQFVLYYQPQVDLATGLIVGAEALLRWRRPGVGIVGPNAFLPRAEENGLILPMSEWVLRDACMTAKSWQRAGLPPLRVSVNLSPAQFRRRTLPLLVAKILGETGLDPRRLDLELTESIVMHDFDEVTEDLQRLLQLGVHLAIDDFGTGYSSLGYVKRFPITRLKIDQSFIRDMAADKNDAAIVRAIITLGHSMNITVVAEGVETADQLAKLRAEGCDEVQGYYFGRPMPSDEFVELVRREPALAKIA